MPVGGGGAVGRTGALLEVYGSIRTLIFTYNITPCICRLRLYSGGTTCGCFRGTSARL